MRTLPALALALAGALLAAPGGVQAQDGSPPAEVYEEPTEGPVMSGEALFGVPEVGAPPAGDTHSVRLDVFNLYSEVRDGIYLDAGSFGGTVPSPTIHVSEGDTVEVKTHLRRTTGYGEELTSTHAISFHSAQVNPKNKFQTLQPGETIEFQWTADEPGLYLYHCYGKLTEGHTHSHGGGHGGEHSGEHEGEEHGDEHGGGEHSDERSASAEDGGDHHGDSGGHGGEKEGSGGHAHGGSSSGGDKHHHAPVSLYDGDDMEILEHIAHGMYGAVIVEPEGGWPTEADEEYVLVQSEIYGRPKQLDDGRTLLEISLWDALRGHPRYVMFNGGFRRHLKDPLEADPGDRVRLFVVNAGPSDTTSFNVTGAIFDRVYRAGNPDNLQRNLSTVTIGPGGTAIVEFVVPEAGEYRFTDHEYTDAVKGAAGIIKAE